MGKFTNMYLPDACGYGPRYEPRYGPRGAGRYAMGELVAEGARSRTHFWLGARSWGSLGGGGA
eukprot:352807-Chlamydomonas_euryale.AAC.3